MKPIKSVNLSDLLLVTIGALFLHTVSSCTHLHLSSEKHGSRYFSAMTVAESHSADLFSGRASYVTVDDDIDNDKFDKKTLYLYHCISHDDEYSHGENKANGFGRWIINDVLGRTNSALSFVNSWAVTPTLINTLADNYPNLYWKIHNGDDWVIDEGIEITCISNFDDDTSQSLDTTIYFSVEGSHWEISGYFVEQGEYHMDSPVYSHIGTEEEQQTYLYKLDDMWIIGHNVGEEDGIAYTIAPDAYSAWDLVNSSWLFVTHENPVWQPMSVNIITSQDVVSNVYIKLAEFRNLSSIPTNQQVYNLRNGISIPSIGLGTGGLNEDKTIDVITSALQQGYRLLDSARDYDNEVHIGDILLGASEENHIPNRQDVFIISKVWPTFLGFVPTNNEIKSSLHNLQSSYVDLFLIHWPTCRKSASWMHCEDSVDPLATWKQSWNALEKAYAEGRVASIGVSNFDTNILDEFWDFGSVRPHVVQNWAEPGKLDLPVRNWCSTNNAIYMPYAHQRNLKYLSPTMKDIIDNIAKKYGVSSHVIVSRFFFQTGAAIIPRTSDGSHLKQNLDDVLKFTLTNEEMLSLGWSFGELPAHPGDVKGGVKSSVKAEF